jgi:uncharacterized SAM-binding protein YcdF (DUF218 family)
MQHFLEYVSRPAVLLPLIVGLGLLNLWRRRREKVSRLLLITIPLAVLAVISIPAVAYVALGTLEWQFPPATGPLDSPVVLVVLSGYIHGPEDDRLPVELSQDTFYRCMHAVLLYEKAKDCKILVSGGIPEAPTHGPAMGRALQAFFLDQGVDRKDLIVESHSRTTYENAVESARLLREQGTRRVMLVTDARHMLRASLCFKKQGIHVVPAPCNYLTYQFRNRWENYWPSPSGAAQFQEAFHEWLGLVYYRARGWL